MPLCYLGIGSNLGNRRDNIKMAIALLKRSYGISVKRISRIIQTKPVGYLKQPEFLNGVIKIQTELKPRGLLKSLKGIEDQMGRKKTIRFGPRIIDLDILLYGDKKIKQKYLIIPHPQLKSREFVLKSLSEIAPGAVKKLRNANN